MNIIVVEDDPSQADDFLREFSSGLPSIDIRHYSSVAAFLSAVPELERDPPVFFILDLMIRWRSPGDGDFPKPENLAADTAGIFLAGQIRGIDALRFIPIVIWTVIEPETIDTSKLDPATRLLSKSDYSIRDMTNRIRSILIANNVDLPKPNTREKALVDSLNLKPSAFGFSVDLKQVYSALKPKKKRK